MPSRKPKITKKTAGAVPAKQKGAASSAKKTRAVVKPGGAKGKSSDRKKIPIAKQKSAIKTPTRKPSRARPSVAATSSIAEPIAMTTRERKVAIRKEVRAGLQKMRERSRRSEQLCEAIISHPTWRRSTIVAIFAPMEQEPDVELHWKHAVGKTLCYPTIRQGGIDFIGVTGPESVILGQFGFREPVFDQARVIPPDTFDLVLVPGAAFTANGDRLGRGGGFYDRLLVSPGFRAFKVGVCFDRQVLDEVPMEAHDQRVHRVVTESGWLHRPDFVKKK